MVVMQLFELVKNLFLNCSGVCLVLKFCSEADNSSNDQVFSVTLYVTHDGTDHEINQLLRFGKPLPPKPAPLVQPQSEPYANGRSSRFSSGERGSRHGFGDHNHDDQNAEVSGRGGFRCIIDKKLFFIRNLRQISKILKRC